MQLKNLYVAHNSMQQWRDFEFWDLVVCWGQRRQSGLKTGCVVGPDLKTEVSWALNIQQTEWHSTGFRLSCSGIFI